MVGGVALAKVPVCYFGVDPVGDHRRGTVYRHARGVALVGADGEDQFPVVLVGQHVEERLAQIGRGCRAVLVGDGDALRVDRHGAAGGRRALGDQRGVDRGDVVCARREFEGQLLGSDRFSAVSITEATFSDAAPPCMRSARIVVKRLRLNLRLRPGVSCPGRRSGTGSLRRQQVVFAVVLVTLLRAERAERNGHRGLRSGDARRTVVRVECAVVPFAGLGGQRALERAGFRVEGELPRAEKSWLPGALWMTPRMSTSFHEPESPFSKSTSISARVCWRGTMSARSRRRPRLHPLRGRFVEIAAMLRRGQRKENRNGNVKSFHGSCCLFVVVIVIVAAHGTYSPGSGVI